MAHSPSRDATAATLAQACDAIAALVTPLTAHEIVPLAAADGRVLAEPLAAQCDLPAFDNAAVDGYAARHADLAAGPLPVAGRVAAGQAAPPPPLGTALRIFTGAPLPAGLDIVAMQEDVVLADGRVSFPAGLPRGANLRRRGEDLACGTEALPAGRRLQPQDLALAAALGVGRLAVSCRVRVALFSTGDELVEPGAAPGKAQRHDCNRVMLAALLARAGAVVTDLGILPDRRGAVEAALAAAEREHDLLVTSGGVSVGEEDHVKAAVAARGALTSWRLPIKPGRPVAVGRCGPALFVGLPGNPVAAFVTGTIVLRPILARLTGEILGRGTFAVIAGFDHTKRPGLREYVRVTLEREGGLLTAHKHDVEGAAILTSLTRTQGLADIAEDVTHVRPGDVLPFLPYDGLF